MGESSKKIVEELVQITKESGVISFVTWILKEEDLLIDGVAAIRVTGSLKANRARPGGVLEEIFVLLPKQEMSFILSFARENLVLIDLILSTFKFID